MLTDAMSRSTAQLVGKFISKKNLAADLAAVADQQKTLVDAVAVIQKELSRSAAPVEVHDERKPPRSWLAIAALAFVTALIAFAVAQIVYTEDAGSVFRTSADVIGAALVLITVLAQSVLVVLDAWGVAESDRVRSATSLVSIFIGLVGGVFVVIGALNSHGG